jgi:predicted Zn-dependent peptidase
VTTQISNVQPVARTILADGVTVLTQPLPDRRTISLGIWVRSGSRDEPRPLLGVTHFIEHMMFKGTESRDARAIAASLESLGGHLDAFTSREQVCYTARVLSEHLPQAVEVLADLVCRSRFEPGEIEREKSVIREEILSYEDSPEEKVADLLAEQLWGDHALGRPILGTVETIHDFDRDALRGQFVGRYRADQLVIAAAGGLEHAALVAEVERWLAPPAGAVPSLDQVPDAHAPSVRHEVRDLQQLYLSLGARGVAYSDPLRYPLVVAETLLGGGMSSRLFQRIREEAGLAYSVFSSLDLLRDGGLLAIHLGVSPEKGREALRLLREEMMRLLDEGPAAEEVEAAKMQLKGAVLMAQESVSSRMYHVARQELYLGRHTPAEDQVEHILAVTRDQAHDALRRFARPERFSLAALGPEPGGALSAEDWPVAAG